MPQLAGRRQPAIGDPRLRIRLYPNRTLAFQPRHPQRVVTRRSSRARNAEATASLKPVPTAPAKRSLMPSIVVILMLAKAPRTEPDVG